MIKILLNKRKRKKILQKVLPRTTTTTTTLSLLDRDSRGENGHDFNFPSLKNALEGES